MHKDALRQPSDAHGYIETHRDISSFHRDALRYPSDAPRVPSFNRDAKDAPSFHRDSHRRPKTP